MEYQKIINLLGKTIDSTKLPRYTTRKWIEVYDQSNGTYNYNKDIRFKTPQVRSDFCDWEDAYLIVTGKITVTNPNNNVYDKKLALKNNTPFYSFISRINGQLIDDCQDLDIVMPFFNLLYYSKTYQKTTGSLWNYYRDEPNSGAENNFNYSIKDSKSFSYKKGLIRKLEGNNTESQDIKIALPLKYLSKFFRSLEIPLLNCEVSLDIKWSKNCVLTLQATRPAGADSAANPAVTVPTNAEFSITDCKLNVSVINLSTEYEINYLKC